VQFEDVEYKVRSSQAASTNPVKSVMSKVATQHNVEEDRYKKILKGMKEALALVKFLL